MERDERLVEISPALGRPTFHQRQIVRGEHADPKRAEQITRPLESLTVDLHSIPTAHDELRLDQELAAFPDPFCPDNTSRSAVANHRLRWRSSKRLERCEV